MWSKTQALIILSAKYSYVLLQSKDLNIQQTLRIDS